EGLAFTLVPEDSICGIKFSNTSRGLWVIFVGVRMQRFGTGAERSLDVIGCRRRRKPQHCVWVGDPGNRASRQLSAPSPRNQSKGGAVGGPEPTPTHIAPV